MRLYHSTKYKFISNTNMTQELWYIIYLGRGKYGYEFRLDRDGAYWTRRYVEESLHRDDGEEHIKEYYELIYKCRSKQQMDEYLDKLFVAKELEK